jgi:glutathione S-transferase
VKTLDDKLVSQNYLCGSRMTLGDIVVYSELSMFLELCDMTATSQELK